MKNVSKNKRYISSDSFLVNNLHTDHEKALSICNILQAINGMNDETILALFGALDYDHIRIKHFNLDITGKAFANDIVTLYSYASTANDHTLSINITAKKKSARKEIPIINGSFVFDINSNVKAQYSLS